MMLMLVLMLVSSAGEPASVWGDPVPPRQETLLAYTSQASMVFLLRVERLTPFRGEVPFGGSASEVHMTVVEALKGTPPSMNVWFAVPDHMFGESLYTELGTELLVFGNSGYDGSPKSTANLHPLANDVSILLRTSDGKVSDARGKPVNFMGNQIHRVASFQEASTWTDLLRETRSAANISRTTKEAP